MVVREMLGELSASHLGIYKYGGGGVSTGRLGIYHHEDHDGPGVHVRRVIPDGPAERAGIEPGDYIVSIDGTRDRAGRELPQASRGHGRRRGPASRRASSARRQGHVAR